MKNTQKGPLIISGNAHNNLAIDIANYIDGIISFLLVLLIVVAGVSIDDSLTQWGFELICWIATVSAVTVFRA